MVKRVAFLVVAAMVRVAVPAVAGQAPPQPPAPVVALPAVTVCGISARPAAQPPAGSGPVVLFIAPCFEAQGGVPLVDPQTYLYYIQLKQSRPSEGVWMPYDGNAEKAMLDDFQRLMKTNFLDNLSIEVNDYPFPNGAVGKIVVYNMEERQRIKIGPDFVGTKKIEIAKIDERLKAESADIRLDTFIDAGLVRKVEGIVRDMLREKGFQGAEVTHEIKALAGGPKLVHLIFHMSEGPNYRIRHIDFTGNKAFGDRTLKKQMKDNKERWFLSFVTGRGTYQEAKFDEDAQRVVEFYQDRGYIRAVVGAPELKVVGRPSDPKTRTVDLKVSITEGPRYRVGEFDVAGNTVIKSDFLTPLFDHKPGQFYSLKKVRKGLDKAREMYGAGGYFEFTGYPDLRPRDEPDPDQVDAPAALRAPPTGPSGPPIVDVTMRLVEGQQYFVNRIVFTGNTTTHDNVIRRELRLVERGVFNTEALKFSVRRLNQLGYFKPLEVARDVTVDKTPDAQNRVDVKVKLEEQNRNQVSFGAGVSEFEGFFGQASFQTSNFLGRGESLTLSVSAGSRAQNYTLGFTEPFLFDRNITGGINLFRNDIRYIGQFTQKSAGGSLTSGYPLGGFSRLFMSYSYERVRVTEVNTAYTDPLVLQRNPFLRDSLLIGQRGERIISKVTPSFIHNTLDQPIFPSQGKRYTLSMEFAGLGGTTSFYKPMAEGIWFWRQNGRMSLGTRVQAEYIRPYAGTTALPIFERLFLGGEYSVRGFDIRSIGPQDPVTGLVLGGDKSLLFNLEQNFNIASQVRLIGFFDAGQVRDTGQAFAFNETLTERVYDTQDVRLTDPYAASVLLPEGRLVSTRVSAFKTSTGLEVRFFMPVLNVPFRLIFAYNPQRVGVRDNSLQPQRAFQFRFAVGSTF